jgi:hypothetical protein
MLNGRQGYRDYPDSLGRECFEREMVKLRSGYTSINAGVSEQIQSLRKQVEKDPAWQLY